MIDKLIHAGFVIASALIGLKLGITLSAIWGSVIYLLGREIAQAEYRWIQHYGFGKRYNMPWWGPFDPRVWDVHSFWWNLTLPILIAIVLGAML